MSVLSRSLSRGRTEGFTVGSFLLGSHLSSSSHDRIFLALQSTGRGGAGNYRSPSREHAPGGTGPEDYSDTRGRDPIPSRDPDVVCDLLLLLAAIGL